MRRESFELQKLRGYRHILSNTGERVEVRANAAGESWRQIVASITPERRKDPEGRMVTLTDRVEFFCIRDEADPDYSGIAQIPNAMMMRRIEADASSPTKIFTFRGEVLEEGRHYWRVIFERERKVAQGGR
jgi:hypothetical protein